MKVGLFQKQAPDASNNQPGSFGQDVSIPVAADMADLYYPAMKYLVDRLRVALEQFWGAGIGLIVLLILIVALAEGLLAENEAAGNKQRGIPVVATITELRIGASKYRPGLMASVFAQDQKGMLGDITTTADSVVGCKVGDKIKAKRVGIALILVPRPCQ